MKKKFTKMEMYGIVAVLLAAAFYGYLTQIYDPANARLETLQSEISAAQVEINQQRGVLAGAPVAREKVEELETAVAKLEAALAEIKRTAKAADDRSVTEAMDLIDRLATGENLTVKNFSFGRRISALGQEPETPQPQRRRGEPEVPPTIRDHFGWQEYRMVFSGSRSEIIAFMERLSQAVWLVRVNDLRVNVVPPARDGEGPSHGEYEIALTLIL